MVTHAAIVAGVAMIAQELQRRGVPLVRVVLFGSHARGEATAQSDIDLVFVVDRPPDSSVRALTIEEEDALWRVAFFDALPPPPSRPRPGTPAYEGLRPWIDTIAVYATDPTLGADDDPPARQQAIRAALREGREVWSA